MSSRAVSRVRLIASLAVVLAVLFVSAGSRAQIVSRGDLFGPGATPPTIGVEAGLGNHSQQGSFLAACGCEFTGGTGSGMLGNIVFELPLSYDWVIGLKGGVDFKNTASVQSLLEDAIIRFESNDSLSTSKVPLDRHGTIKTTYLSAIPFVKYQFFRLGPFIQVGPSFSFLVGGHFNHTRELTTTSVPLSDGTITNNARFEKTGTKEEEMEDGEITGAKGMRLGAQFSVGYDIGISARSIIAPMFTYDLPLSTVRDVNATDWKISSLNFSAILRLKLD